MMFLTTFVPKKIGNVFANVDFHVNPHFAALCVMISIKIKSFDARFTSPRSSLWVNHLFESGHRLKGIRVLGNALLGLLNILLHLLMGLPKSEEVAYYSFFCHTHIFPCRNILILVNDLRFSDLC